VTTTAQLETLACLGVPAVPAAWKLCAHQVDQGVWVRLLARVSPAPEHGPGEVIRVSAEQSVRLALAGYAVTEHPS